MATNLGLNLATCSFKRAMLSPQAKAEIGMFFKAASLRAFTPILPVLPKSIIKEQPSQKQQ